MADQRVLILDFGSQYTQLIARRVRQLRVYCEIHPHNITAAQVEAWQPSAIILSGGPASVYGEGAPGLDKAIVERNMPILGICYGQQLLTHMLGGKVIPSNDREYGRASVTRTRATAGKADRLLHAFNAGDPFEVWMSHGDRIEALPNDFVSIASTESTPFAAIAHVSKSIFGLQFHPEVAHTPRGIQILEAFLFDIADLKPDWTMGSFLDAQVKKLRADIPKDAKVICALSGGV
ncbi:MAG: glutamine-hydrolyzing GMP synthase, partial [Clostridia bacterium]|nr:glutamine-hydrolyzing GMP synthase [Deltaproteobacteria bacterium]